MLAYRRRPELSQADPLVDQIYGHGQLAEMIAQADYLCAAAPNVPSATGARAPRVLGALTPVAKSVLS